MVFQQIRHLFITLDATDKATRKLKQVDRTTDDLSRTQVQAAENTRKFRRRLVAAGFGAAILTGVMARMVTQTAEVDRTFARISGTSGATAEEMAKITGEAEKIGAEMPVLMSDAAQSFEQLSYAGFTVEEQLAAANDVTELAIAGNIEMAQAARVAATTIRAFGLEADEVSQVTNTMAATFTNSAFTIEQLAQSLEYVQNSAAQAGQSINEVVAALGTLADVGLSGTKAGTSLERMFTRLAKQNGETEDAMAQLGLTMDDITDKNGDFLELSVIVQLLNQRVDALGVGGAETLKIMQELFGARGGRAGAALTNNIDKFLVKIGDNARAEIHATMAMLNEMNETELARTNEVLNMIVSDFENISFSIGAASSTQDVLAQLVTAAEVVDEADLANAVGMAFDGISGRTAEILAADVAALQEIQAQADSLSDTALQQRVQTEFGLDQDGAAQMAQAIRAGEGTAHLASSIEDMTISAELAQKQVESLWGEIEYLQGSVESLVLKMVAGAKPALDVFFAGAKGLLDVLNSNRAVVAGLGLGLSLLTASLLVLTAVYAKLAISSHLTTIEFWNQTGASSAATAATRVQTGATNLLTAAKNGVFVATVRETAATYANAASKWANEMATLALVAANVLLGRQNAFLAMQQLSFNNTQRLSTILKTKSALASYGLAAAEFMVAGASALAAGAVGLLSGAWVVFLALPLIGQLAIIAGLLLALLLTVGEITGKFIGWTSAADQTSGVLGSIGDTINWLLTPVYMLIDGIMWVLGLLVELADIAIMAYFNALADTILWLVARFMDLYHWYEQLGTTGKVLLGILLPILPIMYALGKAMDAAGRATDRLGDSWEEFKENVGEGWAAFGLMIGDEIRTVLTWLDRGRNGFDSFAADVNQTIGWIASLVSMGTAMLDAVFSGNFKQAQTLANDLQSTFAMGPGVGAAAGLSTGSSSSSVSQQNQMSVIFQGEVHDVQKVEEQVRRGVKEASDEAKQSIADSLGMASDS
ncbi:phage tail tape measure protein (plasmid) [Halorarum halophilum]|uniref:Phage tail tape measure protein n=1 Tax=Halorarum halophilum TaxID=2743090 RepID=A0A7D5K465_9EURY|nr:phage tail tape measure protein [Halobaculum halophilum]QLG30181.1 phage tail tape measure protein [Halobaculum halophilum]